MYIQVIPKNLQQQIEMATCAITINVSDTGLATINHNEDCELENCKKYIDVISKTMKKLNKDICPPCKPVQCEYLFPKKNNERCSVMCRGGKTLCAKHSPKKQPDVSQENTEINAFLEKHPDVSSVVEPDRPLTEGEIANLKPKKQTCVYVSTKGKNKGLICGKSCKEGNLCYAHKPKTPKTSVEPEQETVEQDTVDDLLPKVEMVEEIIDDVIDKAETIALQKEQYEKLKIEVFGESSDEGDN